MASSEIVAEFAGDYRPFLRQIRCMQAAVDDYVEGLRRLPAVRVAERALKGDPLSLRIPDGIRWSEGAHEALQPQGWTAHFMRHHTEQSTPFGTFADALGFLYRQEWDGWLSARSVTSPDGSVAWSRDGAEELGKLAERLGVEDY